MTVKYLAIAARKGNKERHPPYKVRLCSVKEVESSLPQGSLRPP